MRLPEEEVEMDSGNKEADEEGKLCFLFVVSFLAFDFLTPSIVRDHSCYET